VDEAVEALRTDQPTRLPVTLTREQRREQQLHRMALQHGLRLRKSVRGDERARHFGTYGLYDKRDVMMVGSPESGYGLGLDDVEATLTERRRR
jgi:hypothetical protein